MKKKVLFLCILTSLFWFSLFLVSCKKEKEDKPKKKFRVMQVDLFSMLVYPEWMTNFNYADSAIYTDIWRPFPILGLNKKKAEEVIEQYGAPSRIAVETFIYGKHSDGRLGGEYDLEILLSDIPQIEICCMVWSLPYRKYLTVYFINEREGLSAFYGYLVDPALNMHF